MVNSVFILYCLVAYGLTNLLVFGEGPWGLLSKFRTVMGKISKTFDDMLSCMMCTSANVGLVLSALNIMLLPTLPLTPFNILVNNPELWYVTIFLDLCATSGIVWLIHSVQEMCEKIGNKD